jgi:hypothetical protein
MSAMEKACAKCGGMGVLDQGGPSFVECECAIVKRLSYTMPNEIARAMVLPAHVDHPIVGMVRRTLFVTVSRLDLNAILKACMYKYNGFYVRVTSDLEIKDVGVGSKSRKARGEDAGVVYNDFSDLMDGAPLVVVRLNCLYYKNKAAAGFLMEAISCRIDKAKPLWVVEDPSSKFNEASFAWSEPMGDMLRFMFDRVEVPKILGGEIAKATAQAVSKITPATVPGVVRPAPKLDVEYDSAQQQSAPPRPSRPKPPEKEPDPEPVEPDDGLGSIMGLGSAKSKPFRRGGR